MIPEANLQIKLHIFVYKTLRSGLGGFSKRNREWGVECILYLTLGEGLFLQYFFKHFLSVLNFY